MKKGFSVVNICKKKNQIFQKKNMSHFYCNFLFELPTLKMFLISSYFFLPISALFFSESLLIKKCITSLAVIVEF